jgi:protein-tyrosine phosphatase
MALANDENLRKQFRRPNFHSGGMYSVRQGLMSEAEAIQEEQDDVDTILHRSESTGDCDLSYCNLTAVPSSLVDITSLTRLNLEANNLLEIPDDFGGLCYLRELRLRRNRLRALPSSMCMMDTLEVLDISNNLIEAIPHEFSDMSALIKLVADFNYLGEIPMCVIIGMPALQELYLIENSGIVAVPETPQGWASQYNALISESKRFHLELDNSPELVASIDRFIASLTPSMAARFEVKYNKIWPDMVVDHVALGSLRTVQSMPSLQQLGVTHVLTCGRNLRTPQFPPPIQQMVLDVDDNDEQDMNQYFLTAIEFMQSCVASGGLCIVHCFAGVSRSATVVVAFLMKSRRLTFTQALEFVQQQRPAANPNPNFRRQLIEFESVCGLR